MSEKELFQSALDIADPQQRQAFLDQACGTDTEMRRRIEKLLASHDAASQFLNVPAMEQTPKSSGHLPTIDVPAGSPLQDLGDDDLNDDVNATDLSFLEPSTKPGSIGRLGHYEILQILGQGAFGVVFKAFDEKLHRVVAIKSMTPQLAVTSPPRKRFLREARAVAALKNENVIQIYSVEEHPLPYLAMEFVDGQTLQQKLDGTGPLDVLEFLHLGKQMATGLAAAHDKGLIHRDIKPGNILLENGVEQKVKITDFGLARAADDATMTRTGTIAGTPLYMAPEQARGETLDHRADLFSLGSVFYQMISGRPPFRAANTMAVLKRVCEDTPRPISDIISGTPAWLETIVSRLLEKNRDYRYQSAQELADLLARCQNELTHGGKVTCVEVANRAAESDHARPATANGKNSTWQLVGWLLGGVLAVALFVGLALMNRGKSTSAPSTDGEQGYGQLETNAGSQPSSFSTPGSLQFDGVDDFVRWSDLPFPKNEPFKIDLSATIDELPSGTANQKFLMNWGLGCMVTIPIWDKNESRINVEFNSAPGVLHQHIIYADLKVGQRFDLTIEHRNGFATFVLNGKPVPDSKVWYRLRENGEYVKDAQRQAFQPIPLNQYCYLAVNKSGLRANNGNAFAGSIHGLRLTKGKGELIADFDFSRDGGDRLYDLSGNGYDGEIVGAKWIRSDSPMPRPAESFALQFEGVDDYVEILDLPYPDDEPIRVDLTATVAEVPTGVEKDEFLLNWGMGLNVMIIRGKSPVPILDVSFLSGNQLHQFAIDDLLKVGQQFDLAIEHREGHVHFVLNGQPLSESEVRYRLLEDGEVVEDARPQSFQPIGLSSACYVGINTSQLPARENRAFCGTVERLKLAQGKGELVADFDFSCDSHDAIHDRSGNGHDGKIVGAKWVRSAKAAAEIDLLAAVDTAALDSDKMKWQQRDGILSGRGAAPAGERGWVGLTFPAEIRGDYDLIFEFKQSGYGPLQIDLPLGGEQAIRVHLGGARGCALMMIDGKADQNAAPPYRNDDVKMKRDTWHRLTATVFHQGQNVTVEAALDGSHIGRFSGDRSRIALPPWVTPDPLHVSLAGMADLSNVEFDIRRASITSANSERSSALASWHGWPADAPQPAIAPFDAAQAKRHQEAWAAYLKVPVEREIELAGGEKLTLVLVPPGEFVMGASAKEQAEFTRLAEELNDLVGMRTMVREGPEHVVALTKPFYMGKYETTVKQWKAVVGSNPTPYDENANCPVTQVSWNDIQPFLHKVNQSSKVPELKFALPTEAQWEYACRAGTITPWASENLDQVGWYDANAGDRIHAVGELQGNAFGLHDLHGNVWEWCTDWFGYYQQEQAIDPLGPAEGTSRVFRGGVWISPPYNCRSARRTIDEPDRRKEYLGFRLVANLDLDFDQKQATGWQGWPADAPKPAIAPFTAEQAKQHQEEWAAYLKVPVEYTNSIGMKFKLIPPGEFLMGSQERDVAAARKLLKPDDALAHQWMDSEPPMHRVVLTKPIYIASTEVTQAQYKQVTGANPASFSADGEGRQAVAGMDTSQFPVESISWIEAAEFCAKLSSLEEWHPYYRREGEGITVQKGEGYRLPSEAEWEFACRGGTNTKYWTGDEDNQLVRAGWTVENSGGRMHAVGELEANSFGLFDVYGNAFEWVGDSWDPKFYLQFVDHAAVDPVSPFAMESKCVMRGGNWFFDALRCRSSSRIAFEPWFRGINVGLRLALTVEAVKDQLAKHRAADSDSKTSAWHNWPADAPKPAIAPFTAEQAKKHQEEWAAYLKVPVEYTNSIGMKFKLIPPGEFLMGSKPAEIESALKSLEPDDALGRDCMQSESPQHRVVIEQPFYLGIHEVTQSQYEKMMGANPSHFSKTGEGRDTVADLDTSLFPVESVAWIEAAAFCEKLSNAEKLKPFYLREGEGITPQKGTGYRLPSEAEWEFACRAGTTTKYWIGEQDDELSQAGWFGDNSGGRIHAVGELKSNPFGLFDVHGNAFEWVETLWEPVSQELSADSDLLKPRHVIRGGIWFYGGARCRSSTRLAFEPWFRGLSAGFRIALPVDSVKASDN